MKSVKHLLLYGCFCVGSQLVAQNDPTLITLGNNKTSVNTSEFKYSYEKYMGAKADYSAASLKDYAELYANFKLRVLKAKELGLLENKDISNELQSYRKQLSNSYLNDKEVVDKLVREAFTFSKEDVEIAHIMIAAPAGSAEMTLNEAKAKILAIQKRVNTGNFNEVAATDSEDPSAKKNKGNLGWFSVLQLPYELENAAFKANKGEIAGPVLTHLGYHLVFVKNKRAALGQVQASHILIRTKEGDDAKNQAAETTIKEVYQKLKKGVVFDTLVVHHSEDNNTKNKSGNLGWFGINKYDAIFEEKAFSIKTNNEFTEPFKTASGWHIIKRLNAQKYANFDESKTELTARVKRDKRFGTAQNVLVEKIKKEQNYTINEPNLQIFKDSLGSKFTSYEWREPKFTDEQNNKTIMTIGTQTVTIKKLSEFAYRNSSFRLNKSAKGTTPAHIVGLNETMSALSKETALRAEESLLEAKYPDFKALMREYEEGILRFEATKKEVWDKAGSDEKGLEAFFAKNASKYKWSERAKLLTVTINSTDPAVIKKVTEAAAKKSIDKLVKEFNKSESERLIEYAATTCEKEKCKGISDVPFKAGSVTPSKTTNNGAEFTKIEEIVKPSEKTLAEAKGYVVADYQDFLEKEWVKQLRETYPVKIDEAALLKLKK
jgi:peptidyl-prolyl cis-trans isomerase SurA